MDQANRTFCKLCLKGIIDGNFQVLGEVILEVLSVLSLNVNLDEKCNYMCNDCSVKLFAAFDFKVICLDTEDSLFPFVHSKKARQIDLRDVYLKVKGGNATFTSNQEICRLCMHVADDDGFISIEKMCNRNMVDKYIPQINFSSTKDPVVCKQCYNSLSIHIDWLRKWMDIEKKIKIEAEDSINDSHCKRSSSNASDDNFLIKSEEIHVKCEEHNEDGDTFLSEMKKEILNERVTSTNTQTNDPSQIQRIYECDECDYRGKQKNHLLKHQLQHKDPSQKQKIRHRDPSKVQLYKCDECDYQAKRRSSVTHHQLRHRDPSEVQMYKCDECDYQTKRKCYLTSHQLRHKDPSEVRMYKCDECDYQTKHRRSLTQHLLRHRDPSKIQMYKCDECDYQTKHKSSITQHNLLRHRDPSEVRMYKCNECDHQTKQKGSLIRHQLRHANPSEVQIYKCCNCDFQTNIKCYLRGHQLGHRDPSEVQMYKCDECDYQTKWKSNLTIHQLRHKDPSELQMYKCDECEFQTKRKGDLMRHRRIMHKRHPQC